MNALPSRSQSGSGAPHTTDAGGGEMPLSRANSARVDPSPPVDAAAPVTVIRPTKGWVSLQLRVLWEYRELLYFLIWRDVKVHYKQTVIGFAWAILQPVTAMVIFSIVFGAFARIPSDGLPYPIFIYAALLPWNYFAGALARASTSLVGNASLITKVYFPRLVVPTAAALSGMVDFAIAFVILLGMMLYYGIAPTVAVFLLPLFLLMALGTALGVGLWLSALNVQYRDVTYVVPFLVQLWLYASPVVYPSSLVPERWRALYGLNPMAGVVEGFRWALLGMPAPPGGLMAVSALAILVFLVTGTFYFQRMERRFADVI